MQLSDLRDYVRRQTSTVPSELPDATIDAFLREAFTRTNSQENQWPWLEKTWLLQQDAGKATIPLPNDVNVPGITGLFLLEGGPLPTPDARIEYRVDLRSHSEAATMYGTGTVGTTRYVAFSVWERTIHLWPRILPPAGRGWSLTGFRTTTDWIAEGPSAQPDCDPRLHQALAHYAIALAYAQQEDDTLENVYMQRWQLDVQAARNAIMEPSQDRPLVMGPHHVSPIGVRRPGRFGGLFTINTPGP